MRAIFLSALKRLAAAAVVAAAASAAWAQTDHRPQWQDAKPTAPRPDQPVRVYPQAPQTLPAAPEAPKQPAMADVNTGLALQGFDPVSYFTEKKPQVGRTEFETVIKGETWRFAQAANLKIFTDEPLAYRPQFGGFDAESVALGAVADADPQIFLILGNALYLFRTEEGRAAFAANAELRAQAHGNWKKLANDTYR